MKPQKRVGRPRTGQMVRYDLPVTEEMRDFVIRKGGRRYLRSLIERAIAEEKEGKPEEQ